MENMLLLYVRDGYMELCKHSVETIWGLCRNCVRIMWYREINAIKANQIAKTI